MRTKNSYPQITQIFFLICVICGPAYGQTTSDRWLDYAAGDYDIFPNVTYAKASNVELKLDLYLPKNRTRPVATLILFHGGGWVDGQKERNVLYLMPYLELGWAAVNVEYRNGHQAPAPAAVEDARCALRWITYHARDYSLDPTRFVLTGTSAGGHLALITGMLPAGNVFDRQCVVEGNDRWNTATIPALKVAAIVNWFGISDVAALLDGPNAKNYARSEEHTSELQSRFGTSYAVFFLNDTATTEIYTLSLHDALPILKVAAIVNWFGISDVAALLDGPNAKNYA